MKIEYDRFDGVRLTYDDKSIVLRSTFFGQPGVTWSDTQIINLAKRTSQLESDIASVKEGRESRNLLPFKKVQLTAAEPPHLSNNSAFKFTDEEGLAYWLRGSIRLTPPATYLSIENLHARDVREGVSLMYLQGKTCFASMSSRSGFNSLIICTSADARKSERRERMQKFGNRIIRITDVNEFSRRIAKLCGAISFLVRDVTYSDAKAIKGFSPFPDHAAEFGGELDESKLEYIGRNWMDELIQKTAAASIFTKPSAYQIERERRFQFSFPTDVPEPRVVEDSSLSELIEVVC